MISHTNCTCPNCVPDKPRGPAITIVKNMYASAECFNCKNLQEENSRLKEQLKIAEEALEYSCMCYDHGPFENGCPACEALSRIRGGINDVSEDGC